MSAPAPLSRSGSQSLSVVGQGQAVDVRESVASSAWEPPPSPTKESFPSISAVMVQLRHTVSELDACYDPTHAPTEAPHVKHVQMLLRAAEDSAISIAQQLKDVTSEWAKDGERELELVDEEISMEERFASITEKDRFRKELVDTLKREAHRREGKVERLMDRMRTVLKETEASHEDERSRLSGLVEETMAQMDKLRANKRELTLQLSETASKLTSCMVAKLKVGLPLLAQPTGSHAPTPVHPAARARRRRAAHEHSRDEARVAQGADGR